MSTMTKIGAIVLLGSLTACAVPPPPYPPQIPFVAVPGPTKTEAEFHQDDTTCRAAVVQLPAEPSAATAARPTASSASAQGALEAMPPIPPGVGYLRCMEVRHNQILPLADTRPPLYAYYPAYPVYYRYGYPWGYPEYAFGFGYGFGFYGGFGGYRGGYGYGFREGGRFGAGYGGWHGGGGYGGGHGGFGHH